MRSVLCLLVVCLFATTAVAQFKNGTATPRTTAPPADTTQKKATNEKGHAAKAGAADPAADTELADALLIAMDADHDGVVTKIEMNKAMAALRKVHKDNKGNMIVPDKAAADPNAAAPAADASVAQGAPPAGGDQRNENEATAWFLSYDRNGDGRLSASEVPQNMRAGLQGADLNGDGYISAAEFQAFGRKMGDRMKAIQAGVNPNGANGNVRNPKP